MSCNAPMRSFGAKSSVENRMTAQSPLPTFPVSLEAPMARLQFDVRRHLGARGADKPALLLAVVARQEPAVQSRSRMIEGPSRPAAPVLLNCRPCPRADVAGSL